MKSFFNEIPIRKNKHLLLQKFNIFDVTTAIFRYVFLIAMCYVVVYPLFYMISSSFKTYNEVLDPSIVWLPRTVILDNYKTIYIDPDDEFLQELTKK